VLEGYAESSPGTYDGLEEEPDLGLDDDAIIGEPEEQEEPERPAEPVAPKIAAFAQPITEEEPQEAPEDPHLRPRNVPLTFTRGATRATSPSPAPELIRFSREDLRQPRRSLGDRAGGILGRGAGARRASLAVLVAGLILVAVWGGLRLGDSLAGDDNDSGNSLAALPTTQGGLRQISCGTAPTVVDQGAGVTLSLESKALNGYAISTVEVRPVSANAAARAVNVRAQGLNVQFDALMSPGPAGRLDEYKLALTLAKGNERLVSECTVQVRAPVNAATTPAPAVTGTVTASGTAAAGTPRPGTTTTPGGASTPTPAAGTPTPVRTQTPSGTAAPGTNATRVP
jgi:hypothetical protein